MQVNIVKQSQAEAERLAKEIRTATAFINTMEFILLDVAHSRMLDAIEEMKSISIYRHKVKYYANRAIDAYKAVEMVLRQNVRGKEQLLYDMLDSGNEILSKHVTNLFYSIKNVLDKHRVENSTYKAHIETSLNLLQLATVIYVDILESLRIRTGINLKRFFDAVNPNGVFKKWEMLAELICQYDKEIAEDIQNDDNCKMSMEIIGKKITNLETIEHICKESIQLNPDMLEEYYQRHPDEAEQDGYKIQTA